MSNIKSTQDILDMEIPNEENIINYEFTFKGVTTKLSVYSLKSMADLDRYQKRLAQIRIRSDKKLIGFENLVEHDLMIISFLNIFAVDEVFRKLSNCVLYSNKVGLPLLSVYHNFMTRLGIAKTDEELESIGEELMDDTFRAEDDSE